MTLDGLNARHTFLIMLAVVTVLIYRIMKVYLKIGQFLSTYLRLLLSFQILIWEKVFTKIGLEYKDIQYH